MGEVGKLPAMLMVILSILVFSIIAFSSMTGSSNIVLNAPATNTTTILGMEFVPYNQPLNLTFDVASLGFGGGGATCVFQNCNYPPYYYDPSGATIGFYSYNALSANSLANSLDMGGIQDGRRYSDCPPNYSNCEQTYLMVNNGISLNQIEFLQNNSQRGFPMSLTLTNGKSYAYSQYSSNQIENDTQQYSWYTNNDIFVIGDGAYTSSGSWANTDASFHWFRTRNPPPHDVLPIANTVN